MSFGMSDSSDPLLRESGRHGGGARYVVVADVDAAASSKSEASSFSMMILLASSSTCGNGANLTSRTLGVDAVSYTHLTLPTNREV